jgi:glycosyltransferase involved in cell wall biosynthesis
VSEAAVQGTPGRLVIAQMLESDGPGGAELLTLRLSEGLRARGHEVVPVGPARGSGWLGNLFRERGFATETFSLRHPLDWACARQLESVMRRRRVDVVHSHEFTMAVYGTAAARLAGRGHVITMHGNQVMTTRWRRRAALRAAFRFSDAVVAVSLDTKRHLDDRLGLRPDVVQVVANGVFVPPGDRDRVRRELGVQQGELLVMASGSLVERKGHAVLIRALAGLDRALPWRLAIAGQGQEREALELLAASLDVADRVHILGFRDDMPDVLAATDICAMPSLWEGLPLALLEAMAAGKPIVASETSGIPEAMTSGREGLLTAPGDVGALGAALDQMLRDPALRARLGRAAAARAAAEFSLDAMITRYETLYVAARRKSVESRK